MKTGPKVLVALAVVVVVVVAGVFFLITNLDSLVERAIEKHGSRATGTNVEVSSVKIGLTEGTGAVSGLSVGNPGGFTTPLAISLGNISLDLDTASVTKDPIVIEEIRVSAPKVVYEVNKAGKANINEIKDNLSALGGAGEPSEPGKAEEGKKILIRRLIIEEGEVEVNIAAKPGEPLKAKLERIELRNVGGEGGSTPGEIATQVVRPLADKAIKAAMRAGAGSYVGQEVEKLKEGVAEEVQKGIGEEGGEAVKKLFGQ